jgi:hypothetical protein
VFHRQSRLVQWVVVTLHRRQCLLEQLLHERTASSAGYAALESPHQIVWQAQQKLFGGHAGVSVRGERCY